jgi:T-complex protein 1 subunit theta
LASQQQEQEVGDGTNFVVVFAGELLQVAEFLLKMGLHISEVMQGFKVAATKAIELYSDAVIDTIDINSPELVKVVETSIGAKQYGYHTFLSKLVIEAAREVMPKKASSFNVDCVRVVKILGGSIYDTQVVRGMVFGREADSAVQKALKAKVAIFTCALDIALTETKGTVLLHSSKELKEFSAGEEKQLEMIIKGIADAGVKVIVTGSGIGELALHFCNRFGIMVVKILSKFELRRLCRVTGATALTRLGPPMAEEMGYCEVVETVEIGSDRCTVFRQGNLRRIKI